LTDISGYRIQYGTSPSNLSQTVTINSAAVTSHTFTGLVAGTYYFAVRTVDSTAMVSVPSNIASKTVP